MGSLFSRAPSQNLKTPRSMRATARHHSTAIDVSPASRFYYSVFLRATHKGDRRRSVVRITQLIPKVDYSTLSDCMMIFYHDIVPLTSDLNFECEN